MPDIPKGTEYLWSLYLDLHNATGGEITYQEMLAYSAFNGELTAFEVDAVRSLNQLYKRSINGN